MSKATDNDGIELDLTKSPAPDEELDLMGGRQWRPDDAVALAAAPIKAGPLPVAVPAEATLPSVAEFAAAKLAQELGYTEALAVGALEDGIRFYQQRTAEACLELGKRLALLNELSNYGEFNKRLELLGFSRTSAFRFMSAARKFSKCSNLEHLIPKIGSQSKLLELLILDDDELSGSDTGELCGIPLDDIDCMSATELRKKLRAYKDGAIPAEKEKPLLEKIESLEKQIGHHERHYGELQLKHEAAERKLKQIVNTKQPGKDVFSIETQAIREEAYALEYGASIYITALKAVLTKVLKEPAPIPEEEDLRMDALGVAVSGIYLSIDNLFTDLQALRGGEAMPPALSGKHVLTDSEKQRLIDCKLMIDHDFNLKKTGREVRRDEENRKAPGRPAGSSNKMK